MANWTDKDYLKMVCAYVNKMYGYFYTKKYTIDDIANHCIRHYGGQFTLTDAEKLKRIAPKVLQKLEDYNIVRKDNGEYKSLSKIDNVFAGVIYIEVQDNKQKEVDDNKGTLLFGKSEQNNDYISSEEFLKLDFSKFGAMLKQRRLIPPSYDRKPEVRVSVANNMPRVELVFRSTTSDSYKTIKIHQNNIYTFTNGSLMSRDHDVVHAKKVEAWKEFKKSSLASLRCEEKRQREIIARSMRERADKIKRSAEVLDTLVATERAFIKRHANSSFEEFVDDDKPYFALKVYNASGELLAREKVVPMSPKTLELCVLKLRDDSKINEAIYIEDFKDKCNTIKEFSYYETAEWDRTIDRLTDYLLEHKKDFFVEDEEYLE